MKSYESTTLPRPYKSPEIFEFGSFLVYAASLVIVAAALGVVAAIISKWIYFIIIFPMVVAAGIAWVSNKQIELLNIRSRVVLCVAALLATCVWFVSQQVATYYSSRSSLAALAANPEWSEIVDIAKMPSAQRELYLDDIIADKAAVREAVDTVIAKDSLWEFFRFNARYMTLTGRSGTHKVGEIGAYIIYGLEGLVVFGLLLILGWKKVTHPFDDITQTWKRDRMVHLAGDAAETERVLLSGDTAGLNALALKKHENAKSSPPDHILIVYVPRKFDGRTGVEVKLQDVKLNPNQNPQKKTRAFVSFAPTAYKDIAAIAALADR